MEKDAGKTISATFVGDEAKLDTVTKRITVKGTTIQKMRKISSLFSDEMPDVKKDEELISFFLNLSFESFLKSGEVEKRLKALTEDN